MASAYIGWAGVVQCTGACIGYACVRDWQARFILPIRRSHNIFLLQQEVTPMTLEKLRTVSGIVGNVLQVLTFVVSLCGLILLLKFHGVL